jgi:hypothetical protein
MESHRCSSNVSGDSKARPSRTWCHPYELTVDGAGIPGFRCRQYGAPPRRLRRLQKRSSSCCSRGTAPARTVGSSQRGSTRADGSCRPDPEHTNAIVSSPTWRRLPWRRTSGPDRARCVPRPRRPGRRVGVTRCRWSEAITERASTNRTAACWRSTGPGLRGWMFGRAADRLHGQLGLVCPSWVSRPSSGEDLFRVAPCRDWVIGATRPPAFGDGILAVAKPRPDDRRAGGVARSESFKAWEPASAGGSALPARTPLIRPGSLALRLASAENRCLVPLPVTPAGANSKTKSPGLHNITWQRARRRRGS